LKRLALALTLSVAGVCLLSSAANAQASRTWVSGLGDDANPCSRTAPCKTFAGAISKTAVWGEINCIDPGGFGALTITKSIAIKCDYDAEAGVLVAGTNGFVVQAASTDVVTISGIDFEGLGPTFQSPNGIKILSAAAVHVTNCTIRGFVNTNGTDGNGIFLANTGTTSLFVQDVLIEANAGSGIEVKPGSGANAVVDVKNTSAINNNNGYRANATGGASLVSIDLLDSVAMGNANSGVNAMSMGGGLTQIMVNHNTLSHNLQFGAHADGGTATIRIGYSTITGNANSAGGTNGGMVQSYANNQINGNTIDTVPNTVPGGLH
jgi:hypothetical protein